MRTPCPSNGLGHVNHCLYRNRQIGHPLAKFTPLDRCRLLTPFCVLRPRTQAARAGWRLS